MVPILYRQYASNVLALADDRFIGEALVSVLAVMAIGVSGAALKGDVRGWSGYHEMSVNPSHLDRWSYARKGAQILRRDQRNVKTQAEK